MHPYADDLSVLDFNFNYSDPIFNPYAYRRSYLTSSSPSLYDVEDDYDLLGHGRSNPDEKKPVMKNPSPPKHRHDGTSPLPLGMDWSLPPRKWDGRNSVWPNNPHGDWSYCVTVPSWVVQPESRGSDSVVFYRVQVGIQSPEGITTARVIFRRFSDFLKLFSELKKEFPMKNFPPAPPKKLLKVKSQKLLEERRCLLEDWMEKLLSDIDVSRSAPAAIFLELEAAARLAFHNSRQTSDETSVSGVTHVLQDDPSASVASDSGNDTSYEASELGTPRHGKDGYSDLSMDNSILEHDSINLARTTVARAESNKEFIDEDTSKFSLDNMPPDTSAIDKVTEKTADMQVLRLDGTEFIPKIQDKMDGHVKRLSTDSIGSDLSSIRNSEASNLSMDLLVTLPSDGRQKLNRILVTLQQRLTTAKTDVEDLLARLNQEMTARQFLITKVKDLEVELETTQLNCRENMHQAVLAERERFTQMQWDIEELRRKCLDMEIKWKSEQDGRLQMESVKASVIKENEMLQQELDVAREQLENLQKRHEELEMKSKTDVKVLIKEVKSLRSSQSELKQQLSEMVKEKLEAERSLHKERQRLKLSSEANAKLLRECGILQQRLQECSVNFLVEEEDKLIVDTSPSDALDLLAMSDNRIGLLLAEAQLLAQDVENAAEAVNGTRSTSSGDIVTTDDELRKLLAHVFVDNASLRKQINLVLRLALNATAKSEDEEEEDEEEEINLRKTVLSQFLEK
ncbi:PX domain-containing protein EREX-like [Neltuma alba]|uniref:PX domain-containing protein EREX-like n=1 Tax=Neltuma alba TaxID=207710 RepID=UPI0010A59E60|nr:PX domain-containing protein EREX-like [Prosopis alba]